MVLETSSIEEKINSADACGRQDLVCLGLTVLDGGDRRVADQARAGGARLVELGPQGVRLVGVGGCDPQDVRQRVVADQLEGGGVELALLFIAHLLRDQLDVADVASMFDLMAYSRHFGGCGSRVQIDVNDYAPANRVGGAVRGLDHGDEDAEDERRDEHTREGGKGRRWIAPHRADRLLEEEAQFHRRAPSCERSVASAAVSRRRRSAKSPVVSSWA
jgi:hypothetical protein